MKMLPSPQFSILNFKVTGDTPQGIFRLVTSVTPQDGKRIGVCGPHWLPQALCDLLLQGNRMSLHHAGLVTARVTPLGEQPSLLTGLFTPAIPRCLQNTLLLPFPQEDQM